MRPGNNGGGNPNHDENGRFTSNGNASSGNNNSEEKQAMELFNLKGSEKKDKYYPSTLDGEILDEEGIEASSEEEAYKIAEQRFGQYGDELTVEKAESEKPRPNLDFLNKLEPNDAEIIKKGLEAIFKSYENNPDIDLTTLNNEWGEELAYALSYDVGVPEEQVQDLVGKFVSVAPSWDDTVGKKYENKNEIQQANEESIDISDDYGLEAVRREIDKGKSFEEIKDFIQKLDPLNGEYEYDDDFVRNYINEAKNATDKNNRLSSNNEEKQAMDLFGLKK